MNDTLAKNIKTRLSNKKGSEQIRFVLEGLIIGLVAGISAIIYRLLLTKAESLLFKTINTVNTNALHMLLWGIFIIILSLITGKLIKWEPMSSGSGIPQVSGEMKGYLSQNPVKVLISKIIGGTLCILSGFSLGREGPSIQLGAMSAKLLAKLQHKGKSKEKIYLSCGAGAGLAAAFNAPLAGAMFTMEEIHKNFDGRIIVSVMTAAITSDFISKTIFGLSPIFHYTNIQTIPLKYFWLIILLGIILGICGSIYNKVMVYSQKIYEKINILKTEYKLIIPAICSFILAFTIPNVLAGGDKMVKILENNQFILSTLITLLLVKFLFSAICFGSGAPGGIFFPLLVLGSFIGAIFAIICTNIFAIPLDLTQKCIILAMAGFFCATVRAPFTGIILIAEMTGSLSHMISISLVCIISYVVAYIFKSEPIYESLLDNILSKQKININQPDNETMLITYNIAFESEVDNKRLDEIQWPNNCLVVAIERGNKEFIPRGYNTIKAGDFITVLINENEMNYMNEILTEMCCEKEKQFIKNKL